jgi:NADH:ubiquinone oxidoreductase subunit F (NADH-binding)
MNGTPRVLDREPVSTLEQYVRGGGGRGLDAAKRLGPSGVVDELEASGLRGRGGAGFPCGRKWRTVAENRSRSTPTTVVVNGSEGEPGSFKDRAILRTNPFRVLEGALIAAGTVGAARIVVAVKASFAPERQRLTSAIDEVRSAGWLGDVDVMIVAGPPEYLFGEETALLEVIDGRAPFPRIAPPYRHGVDGATSDDVSAATVALATPTRETAAAPALVNNVETLAHAACILAEGADWFRTVGTPESPGTIVCTISGDTRRHGFAEVAMGTPVRDVIDSIGGGVRRGHHIAAVMTGVSNPLLPAARLDAPLSYEGMEAAGSGLGTAGFIVFDDTTDFAAVAHGVSRFLAVESCGQCTPCKQDGLALAELFDRARRSEGGEQELQEIDDRIRTVADEARCFLASQHQRVAGSIMALFSDDVRAHVTDDPRPAADEVLIAPIVDLDGGVAVLDEDHRAKQPDWTFNETDSGRTPADSIDQRSEIG